MVFLEDDKTRAQAELQAAAAPLTALTTALTTQQQAVAAAQARVTTARTRVTEAQAPLPALLASAAAADGRAADLNRQIEAHQANEPEPTIERGNKPPLPNPAWRPWKREMDRLTTLLGQAQADATAAHASLNGAQAAVAQAQADVQAAERQVADATAAMLATQTAMAAAQQRQAVAQQRLADLERWTTELARDPSDRPRLELVAADLSARTADLEEAHAVARFQNDDAEQLLAALVARRDQLVPMLNDVNAQLPAVQAERQAAQAALTAAARGLQTHLRRGPS